MATKEHLILSAQIKDVHKNLRKSAKRFGPTKAWNEHINNKDQLDSYSNGKFISLLQLTLGLRLWIY